MLDYMADYQKYKPDGTPFKRYWLDPEDKWWDLGFYFHCFVLIGFWMLYNALTTGHMTSTQFILDHAITVFWVYCAGVYGFVVVAIDLVNFLKENKNQK